MEAAEAPAATPAEEDAASPDLATTAVASAEGRGLE